MAPPGPNPWKVVIVLEELQVPYEIKSFKFEEIKKKPFIDINPNGRVPAIEDPNTDITLWESGAIITYLIEQYDKNHVLSYDTLKEKHQCNQWRKADLFICSITLKFCSVILIISEEELS
ncbi:hypothetical protein FJTKL_07522 [Diaporthe vaccinii]|uniref:glutathione transferase n=1 Tax=Diaporthe vaccinii TaxID=105482 RepID=A0ABR4ETN2_9PEZI